MEETMEELSRLQKWILFDVLPILNYLILQFEVLHNKTAEYDQHSPNFLPSNYSKNKNGTKCFLVFDIHEIGKT